MGNFPQQGEDTLIPLLWIELAMERWEDTPEGSYKKLGVDVAAYGSDKTVIVFNVCHNPADFGEFFLFLP